MLGRLLELVNEWEIQLLVLLSFILQLFLFFTGSLRRRSKNLLLRGTIWIAYLGADIVAIYALGFLSRHADATDNHDGDASSSLRLAHPLAFLWAPFLLLHLGGQDTITAFAIEDNNLWLRHLLNLLVQVTLALYVFWKSSSWHSTQVLVPGILLFVSGIIKYGERTAALRHGNLNNMAPPPSLPPPPSPRLHQPPPSPITSNGSTTVTSSVILDALRWAPAIRMLFASHRRPGFGFPMFSYHHHSRLRAMFKLMDVELGMMYNDLYTKAAVLRTKSGIVFRCISLACTIAALILFFFFFTSSRAAADHGTATSTGTAGRVDTTVTYTLFIGGLVVDICTLLTMLVASPWTWAWLRDRGHHRIARITLCLLSSDMVSGWLGTTRPLWSNTMGQYRFVCYDNDSSPPTLPERVMGFIREQVGTEREKKLFWLSKLLETKDVAVDEDVKLCLVEAISEIGSRQDQQLQHACQWPCLGTLLLVARLRRLTNDFVRFISSLHAFTEAVLCEAAAATMGIRTGTPTVASVDVCRKLSRYMMYLVAAHPAAASLLQVASSNPEAEFQSWARYSRNSLINGQQQQDRIGLLRSELRTDYGLVLPSPQRWHETLEELRRMWARLVVYAASKSRPEAHATELARGGELLTFVWLLLSHHGIGGSNGIRVGLVRDQTNVDRGTLYAFDNLPALD